MVYIFYTSCSFIWKMGRMTVAKVQLREELLNQWNLRSAYDSPSRKKEVMQKIIGISFGESKVVSNIFLFFSYFLDSF